MNLSNKLNKMGLVLEQIGSMKEYGIIGVNDTKISVKNSNSYFIATKNKGCKLLEKGVLLYKGRISSKLSWGLNLLYIPKSNYYLISTYQGVYIKFIDRSPPRLILIPKRLCTYSLYPISPETTILYSTENRPYAFNHNRKKVQYLPEAPLINSMRSYETNLVEKEHSEVRTKCLKRAIFSAEISLFDLSEHCHKHNPFINRGMNSREKISQISFSPDKQFVCYFLARRVAIQHLNYVLLTVRLFKLGKLGGFEPVGFIHFQNDFVDGDGFSECFGYHGDRLVFAWVAKHMGGPILVFDYDFKRRIFRETRRPHGECEPSKFERVGDWWYYTGKLGKVMRLRLEY